jgi:hypothetical protein
MKIEITPNKSAEIKILSARKLELKANLEYPDIKYEKNQITQLGFLDTYTINKGDKVEITNSGVKLAYTINYIENISAGRFFLYETYRNKTSMFLFPLIAKPGSDIDKYYYHLYHYNSYLYCNKYPEFSNGKYLFAVYRFFNHSFYKEFEKELSTQTNLIKTVDIDKDKVLFIFEIPTEYIEGVDLFLSGKFLNFPDKIIKVLHRFYKNSKDESVLQIINNNELRRNKMEKSLRCTIPTTIPTCSIPLITEETLIL